MNKRFKQPKSKIDTLLHPFRYYYKDVLMNINFSIDQSGIYSLVGPNGSGKSTLLRTLCGILLPDSGEILIDGIPVMTNPYKVFLISDSEKGFYPRLSLINNLKFFSSLISTGNRTDKKDIIGLIEEFGLEKEKNTRFQDLSTGIKQRLAIARAMLFDPMILLFDEITRGVDIGQQQIIYDLLRRLREKGKIVIFATHIMDEIINLSDRVILIHDGELLGFSEFSLIEDKIRQIFGIK